MSPFMVHRDFAALQNLVAIGSIADIDQAAPVNLMRAIAARVDTNATNVLACDYFCAPAVSPATR